MPGERQLGDLWVSTLERTREIYIPREQENAEGGSARHPERLNPLWSEFMLQHWVHTVFFFYNLFLFWNKTHSLPKLTVLFLPYILNRTLVPKPRKEDGSRRQPAIFAYFATCGLHHIPR